MTPSLIHAVERLMSKAYIVCGAVTQAQDQQQAQSPFHPVATDEPASASEKPVGGCTAFPAATSMFQWQPEGVNREGMHAGFGRGPRRGGGQARPREGRGGNQDRGQDWRRREGDPAQGNRGWRNDREVPGGGERAELTEGGVDGWVPRPPGFRRLQEWLQLDANAVVTVLANTRNGFAQLLESELQSHVMQLVISLLAKACESGFQVIKTELLAVACSAVFQGRLALYLNTLHTDEAALRRPDSSEVFEQLLLFCETAVALLPTTAAERLSGTIAFLGVAMDNVTNFANLGLPQALKDRLVRLKEKLQAVLVTRAKTVAARRETARSEQQRVLPPPNDFRRLPIFPNATELTTRHRPFLRPHIVDGAYQNADHYLDVQFRLLREDFVQPLRDGICALAAGGDGGAENIRVYHDVEFCGRALGLDRVGLVVKFPKMPKVNWGNSKRLMFGALLCFSRDNFASLLFGTVLERNKEDLEKGLVAVEMATTSSGEILHMWWRYTMVEAEVFFAPYHHVLQGLQAMPSDDFPMSRYIVEVTPHVAAPRYLREKPEKTYDIVDGHRECRVRPLDDTSWPTQMSLNPSQYEAFKAALTREFVVIQGPPGTGKTHVGLMIARNLIENMPTPNRPYNYYEYDSDEDYASLGSEFRFIYSRQDSPMLVVCFTNHALDQFLEGLLNTTRQIVRVGGQSKSELLAPFNLQVLRRNKRWIERKKEKDRWDRRDRWDVHDLMGRTIREEMSVLLAKMRSIQQALTDIKSRRGIVSARTLSAASNKDNNLDMFCDEHGEIDDNYFVDWLLVRHGMTGLAPGPAPFDTGPALNPVPVELPIPVPVELPIPEPEADDRAPGEDRRDGEGENIFDLEDVVVNEINVEYAVSLSHLEHQMNDLQNRVRVLQDNAFKNGWGPNVQTWDLMQWHTELAAQHQMFSDWLTAQQPPAADLNRMEQLLRNPVALWDMNAAERRACYESWLHSLLLALDARLDALEVEYRRGARQLEETRQMADLQILSSACVIGMTTTMAAKLQPLLMALGARIVIVEEAAEITESHIVVSLSQSCEHLILIGDHQQLRPSTASYRMAREFNLDVSLFERMVRNGMHCARLGVQHRMRPEVAQLVSPSIYADLANHESVTELPPVRGVRSSVFFFTHAHREDAVSETSSKRNPFEGDLVLAFCRYLLQQGYCAKQVTILATYSGQMFYLKEKREAYPSLENVHITIVDNFQGEENDIILLTLVRNNVDQKIGFLSITNRVCVALSRAKQGLFIFGNMDCLVARSEIWPKVRDVLNEQGALGDRLSLSCQVHPDQVTEIARAADFLKVPEGGCMLPCNTLLQCGHRCNRQCHAEDREHSEYQCLEPCDSVPEACPLGHTCTRLCHEPCGDCMAPMTHTLACGHEEALACHVDPEAFRCPRMVPAVDPPCGHAFDAPCHVLPGEQRCPEKCVVRLDCGHSCNRNCHALDDPDHIQYKCPLPCHGLNAGCSEHPCLLQCHEACQPCKVQVEKLLPACQHRVEAECFKLPGMITCLQDCERIMPCGHRCALKCSELCGGCQVKVEKVLPECQHTVDALCCVQPTSADCRALCQRTLPCGHPCRRLCKLPCTEGKDCTVPSATATVLGCGHEVVLPCNVLAEGLPVDSEELLGRCTAPCTGVLRCSHPCGGTCGECLQGRAHVRCKEACGRELVCGHVCKAGCAEACPPCTSPCAMQCPHSRCGKRCGVPCTPCKMPCTRRCQHAACGRRCDKDCGVEPCTKPCAKRLRCGHACLGFCGDPCPPLCRECRPEEAAEILFGDEDEPDARFVLLTDCGHSIESGGMERWLREGGAEVQVPRCPRCKRDIVSTQRFKGVVRTALLDIMNIKKKNFGDMNENSQKRKDLLEKLRVIRFRQERVPAGEAGRKLLESNPNEHHDFKMLTTEEELLWKTLFTQLQAENKKRKVYHSSFDLENLRVKVQILVNVHDSLKSLKSLEGGSKAERGVLAARAARLLRSVRERKQLCGEEVDVLSLETSLLQRLDQLVRISDAARGVDVKVELHCATVRAVLLSTRTYSLEDDAQIGLELKPLIETWLEEVEIRNMAKHALNMGRGHWFKCPNGHYYVIDDCGGATTEGSCPDCGATVGGSQHRLRSDNAIATEMDGAVMSAYDENVAVGMMIL